MSYDLLFNINENLEYVGAEFQIDNNTYYARQKGHMLCFHSLLLPDPFQGMEPWRVTIEP